MSDNTISDLFAEIALWATEVKGARNVSADGEIWIAKTEADEHFPASVTVKMNGSKNEIDGIPAYTALLENDVYFPGFMALVGPFGGTMIGAGHGDEDRLIRHFKAQVRPAA